MATNNGPFTKTHEDALNKSLRELNEVEKLVTRCERSNMDCSEYRQQITNLRNQLQAFHDEFFSTGRPDQRREGA